MIVVVAMCFVFKSRSAGLAVRALFGFICVCLELGLRRVGKQGIMRVPPPPARSGGTPGLRLVLIALCGARPVSTQALRLGRTRAGLHGSAWVCLGRLLQSLYGEIVTVSIAGTLTVIILGDSRRHRMERTMCIRVSARRPAGRPGRRVLGQCVWFSIVPTAQGRACAPRGAHVSGFLSERSADQTV